MRDLGILTSVNIREVWALEPQHFSSWLAENLDKLGAAIGVIIWISPEFREEHRAAIDWLNVNTDESKDFFAIQIEALQIDDSRPAPNFRLISFPNDWQKTTSATSNREQSDRRQFFVRYFSELASAARAARLRAQASSVDNSLVLERLVAGVYISAAFSRESLTVGVYIARNDAAENRRIYEFVERDAQAIQRDVGAPLHWDFVEGRRRKQVWTSLAVDRADEVSLERSRGWVIETAMSLRAAFESRLLDALRSSA